MTKNPAIEDQDLSKLFVETDEDDGLEDGEREPDQEREKPAKGKARGEDGDADSDIDFDENDLLVLDDLDGRLKKNVREAIKELQTEQDDNPVDGADPRDAKIAALEKQLNEIQAERGTERENAIQKAVAREVMDAIKQHRMTKEEVERTVLYFQRNPDLEGVMPFAEAASRANPAIGDRSRKPAADPKGSRGADGDEGEIITRTSAAPPERKAFKPTARKSDYSAVTTAIMSSGAARRLIGVTRD